MNELIVGVCGCALLFVGVVVIQELVFNTQKKVQRPGGTEKGTSDKKQPSVQNLQQAVINPKPDSIGDTRKQTKKETQNTELNQTVIQLENAMEHARQTLVSLGVTSDDEDKDNAKSGRSFVDDLQRLIDMKEKGFLTDSEFLEAKKRVLSSK